MTAYSQDRAPAAPSPEGPRPLVGLPACMHTIDGTAFHTAGDKYLRAALTAAGAIPVILPSFGPLLEPRDVIARLDGLMMTGSPSNVHPAHYGAAASPKAEPYDTERDETTLPLIRAALSEGLPLLAVCRGMQELNVALGGTLHPRIHEIEGRMDHRRPKHESRDVQYGPRHRIRLVPNGQLAHLAGAEEATVNSLHWQGIDRLADNLVVEATAEDGTIEGVRVSDARDFALGVQWHPEYRVLENPFSTAIFQAFGAAAQRRAMCRPGGVSIEPETAMGV